MRWRVADERTFETSLDGHRRGFVDGRVRRGSRADFDEDARSRELVARRTNRSAAANDRLIAGDAEHAAAADGAHGGTGPRARANPPVDWEVTTNPVRSDYAGHRWVACQPAIVLNFGETNPGYSGVDEYGRPINADDWDSLDGNDPSEAQWRWRLLTAEPNANQLEIFFPMSNDWMKSGTGLALGAPEHAVAASADWLRVKLDADTARDLGAKSVVFVRVDAH